MESSDQFSRLRSAFRGLHGSLTCVCDRAQFCRALLNLGRSKPQNSTDYSMRSQAYCREFRRVAASTSSTPSEILGIELQLS
jgi:hypothetical protein